MFRANELAIGVQGGAWASAIWSLCQLKEWRGAVRLGHRWREREDLEPWMLIDLAFANRSLGLDEEAHQVNLRSQSLSDDGASVRHRLWLAVEEAIRGEVGVAETWLSKVPTQLSDPEDRFVFGLTRLVITAGDERAFDEAGGVRGLLDLLKDAQGELPTSIKQPAYHRIRRRVIRCIGRQRSRLAAIGWYLRARGV